MDPRNRTLQTLLFGKPDRVPLSPGGGRESTLKRWHAEGLPEGANPEEHAYRLNGGTLEWPQGGEWFSLMERMNPMFEEKVLEVLPNSQIVQDWKGNVCEIGLEFDTRYLRYAMDFVTRSWIRCPVETKADWEEMKKRYDSDDPSRLPEDASERGQRLKDRSHFVSWHFSGPFWQLREWLGFENLCMLFLDDPAWLDEMVEFWTEHVARLLERGLEHFFPDEVHLSEDMAYKAHPMVGPEQTRRHLLPAYRRWGDIIRRAGIPLYGMDSDGYVHDLIPVWLEAGVNVCDPMEVAAGNDLNVLRREFGKDMAFIGGVDKRAMAVGGRAIEDELARLRPVLQSGGFIPSCDHGIPPDVSWDNFVHYVGLLAKETNWL